MKTSHVMACISFSMVLASVLIALVSASDDEGVVWVRQDPGILVDLHGAAWGGGRFVAVGDGGTIVTSTDGEQWSLRASGTNANLNDVAWNGRRFVVVGAGIILSSENGTDWSFRSDAGGSSARLAVVAWKDGEFAAVGSRRGGSDGLTLVSGDGILWSSSDRPSGAPSHVEVAGNDIASNGLLAVAVGPKGAIFLADVSEVFSDDFETGDLRQWSWFWPPAPTTPPTPAATPTPP